MAKFFSAFLNPLLWILGTLLVSLRTKKPRLRRRASRVLVFLLVVGSNPLLLNSVMRWQEPAFTPLSVRDTFDVAIVLGGYSGLPISSGDYLAFNEHANRLFEPLRLLGKKQVKHLLLSGGSGEIFYNEAPEAHAVGRYLLQIGIADTAIWVEGKSRNTHENAIFSAQHIRKYAPKARILLVTSALHMPRAAACFRKIGLDFTPYPVDQWARPMSAKPKDWLLPEIKAYHFWSAILKEKIGYIAYRFKGYI